MRNFYKLTLIAVGVLLSLGNCFKANAQDRFLPTESKYSIMYGGVLYFQVVVDTGSETAWIYSTNANAVTNGTVTIPDDITVNGKTYPIVSIGNTRAQRHGVFKIAGMKKLVLGKNIERIDSLAVTGNADLVEVVWNDKIHSLGDYAFNDCTALTFIDIPATIKTIKGNPFVGCTALENIAVNPMNTDFVTVDDNSLYSADKTTLYCISEKLKTTSLKIPDGVKNLADGCFKNWALKTVDFNDVETIGAYAFTNSRFDTLRITAKIKSIGNAFNYTNKTLKAIVVDPANEWMAVENNILYSKLTGWIAATIASKLDAETLSIPEGVKAIGDYQFYYFKNVKKAVLPSTLEYIGERGFLGCSALEDINFEDTKLAYINRLGFQGTIVKKAIFPPTMRAVDLQCFYQVTSLTEVSFNEGFLWAGVNSFGGTSIEKVVIPSTMNYSYTQPFNKCWELTEAEVKARVISPGLFVDCSRLSKLTLHEGLEEIGDQAFMNQGGAYSEYGELIFPSTLKRIGNMAFQGNSIEHIDLPESCKYIGYGAFTFNHYLESFKTRGCDTVMSRILQESYYLTDIEFNEGLTYMGAAAIINAHVPAYVFPSTLKKCGGLLACLQALNPDTKKYEDTVKTFISKALVPPEFFPCSNSTWNLECAPGTAGALQGLFWNQNPEAKEYSICTLWVPEESIEAYRAAPYWGKIKDIRPIPAAGIDEILNDSNDAPVIYYNLQGVRVNNPESGQVYVKVQGTKATKCIFK